jgi:hypothetical protein
MDNSRIEQIDRWANYVRNNPNSWKKHLKPFLDSQIIIANRFYKAIAKTKKGKEKLKILKNLK